MKLANGVYVYYVASEVLIGNALIHHSTIAECDHTHA
jgi:hypothetical protein